MLDGLHDMLYKSVQFELKVDLWPAELMIFSTVLGTLHDMLLGISAVSVAG